jgi:hypothetical protein
VAVQAVAEAHDTPFSATCCLLVPEFAGLGVG